eukprot:g214.t1
METSNNTAINTEKKTMKRTPSEERIYQARLKDRQSRKGLKQLKAEARAKRAEEKKLAEQRGEKFVAKTISKVKYDDTLANNAKDYDRNDSSTWSSTGGETCSCLYGNPCVDQYVCSDWKNRFEIAKQNGWKLAKR